jgi:hypothetical protein
MRSGARPYKLSSSLVIASELRTSSGTVPSSFSLCNRCASLTIVSWPSEWFRMRILRHLDRSVSGSMDSRTELSVDIFTHGGV